MNDNTTKILQYIYQPIIFHLFVKMTTKQLPLLPSVFNGIKLDKVLDYFLPSEEEIKNNFSKCLECILYQHKCQYCGIKYFSADEIIHNCIYNKRKHGFNKPFYVTQQMTDFLNIPQKTLVTQIYITKKNM